MIEVLTPGVEGGGGTRLIIPRDYMEVVSTRLEFLATCKFEGHFSYGLAFDSMKV